MSRGCPRPGRPLHLGGAEPGEELGRGLVAQGLVGPGVIVGVFPGPQRRLQGRQLQIPVIELPELAARGAVEAFDPAIELGRAGRQDEQRDRLRWHRPLRTRP